MSYAVKQVVHTIGAMALGAFIAVTTAQAQDQTMDQDRDQTQDQTQDQMRDRDQIFGSQLMTRKERAEYRKQMQALNTEQERERFRLEHHNKMQERAQAQGKTLPDMPPAGRGPAGGGARPGAGGRR